MAAENVSGMMPGEWPFVPFVHRLNRNAVAAKPENVMRPPRRGPVNRSAAIGAGRDQLI
jgi:hypothetical protein